MATKAPKPSAKRSALKRGDAAQRNRIVSIAEKYLAAHQPTDYRLVVDPEAVVRRDDWWYVVVTTKPEDSGGYDFISRLSAAEGDLEKREKINVLMVPVLPPDDD